MTGRHVTPGSISGTLRALADHIDHIDQAKFLAPVMLTVNISVPMFATEQPIEVATSDADRITTVDAIAGAIGQGAFVEYSHVTKTYGNNEMGRRILPGTSLSVHAAGVEDPELTELLAAAAAAMDLPLHAATDGGGFA